MSQALTLNDSEKSFTATIADMNLATDDSDVVKFGNVLDQLNGICPIASLVYAAGSYTLTLKDARVWTVSINPGPPPKFRITSTDFWAASEHDSIQALNQVIALFIAQHGMSALNLTYA